MSNCAYCGLPTGPDHARGCPSMLPIRPLTTDSTPALDARVLSADDLRCALNAVQFIEEPGPSIARKSITQHDRAQRETIDRLREANAALLTTLAYAIPGDRKAWWGSLPAKASLPEGVAYPVIAAALAQLEARDATD